MTGSVRTQSRALKRRKLAFRLHPCFIVLAGVMRRRASGFSPHLTRWNRTARHRIECHIL
jgi:hypothetical protein